MNVYRVSPTPLGTFGTFINFISFESNEDFQIITNQNSKEHNKAITQLFNRNNIVLFTETELEFIDLSTPLNHLLIGNGYDNKSYAVRTVISELVNTYLFNLKDDDQVLDLLKMLNVLNINYNLYTSIKEK